MSAVADFCCSCESAKKVAHVDGAAKCIQSKQQCMSRDILFYTIYIIKKKNCIHVWQCGKKKNCYLQHRRSETFQSVVNIYDVSMCL